MKSRNANLNWVGTNSISALDLLKEQRQKINPFELACSIEKQLMAIWELANEHHSPRRVPKLQLGYLFK